MVSTGDLEDLHDGVEVVDVTGDSAITVKLDDVPRMKTNMVLSILVSAGFELMFDEDFEMDSDGADGHVGGVR